MQEKASLFSLIKEYRLEYRELFIAAFKDGLRLVRDVKNAGKYIGSYYGFPRLTYRDNGLPQLSEIIGGGGPVEYRSCFNSYVGKAHIDENEIASFNDLVNYARSKEVLLKRFAVSNGLASAGLEVQFDRLQILSIVKSAIDKYVHKFNSFEFDDSLAGEIIDPFVAFIFDEQLCIDIYVPILFINFNVDHVDISDRISIVRIPDDQHLARYKVKSYNISAHEAVIQSATHALVFRDWYVKNSESLWDFDILSNSRAYPTDLIDKFFGAIRICSDSRTGYGQIYSVSKGWNRGGTADLPCVSGATVRAYPSDFENFHWNIDKVPVMTNEEIGRVSEVFRQLSEATENSISLSLKRLNRCLVRDDEEDAVLDAAIALEALLSDDGKQEMTHKLAMRIGALAGFDSSFGRSAIQAFGDIKSIYGYRSAIVHGSKNIDKSRTIKLDDSTHKPAYDLAVEYVRLVMRVLLSNERFRNPKTIDQELLLGSGKTVSNSTAG